MTGRHPGRPLPAKKTTWERREVLPDPWHSGVVPPAGRVALLILGGAHDLSASVRRLGQGTCEYIRVGTSRYQEFDTGPAGK